MSDGSDQSEEEFMVHYKIFALAKMVACPTDNSSGKRDRQRHRERRGGN